MYLYHGNVVKTVLAVAVSWEKQFSQVELQPTDDIHYFWGCNKAALKYWVYVHLNQQTTGLKTRPAHE